MKKAIGALVMAGLGGCVATGPTTVAWREGATGPQASFAQTDCLIEAANRVPESVRTYTTPVYSTPSNVQCSTIGNYVSCQEYGGQVYGGQTQAYDANADLRMAAATQCLAKKGFSVVEFPACTSEQAKQGLVSFSTGKLPSASAVLCAADGGFVLK